MWKRPRRDFSAKYIMNLSFTYSSVQIHKILHFFLSLLRPRTWLDFVYNTVHISSHFRIPYFSFQPCQPFWNLLTAMGATGSFELLWDTWELDSQPLILGRVDVHQRISGVDPWHSDYITEICYPHDIRKGKGTKVQKGEYAVLHLGRSCLEDLRALVISRVDFTALAYHRSVWKTHTLCQSFIDYCSKMMSVITISVGGFVLHALEHQARACWYEAQHSGVRHI